MYLCHNCHYFPNVFQEWSEQTENRPGYANSANHRHGTIRGVWSGAAFPREEQRRLLGDIQWDSTSLTLRERDCDDSWVLCDLQTTSPPWSLCTDATWPGPARNSCRSTRWASTSTSAASPGSASRTSSMETQLLVWIVFLLHLSCSDCSHRYSYLISIILAFQKRRGQIFSLYVYMFLQKYWKGSFRTILMERRQKTKLQIHRVKICGEK